MIIVPQGGYHDNSALILVSLLIIAALAVTFVYWLIQMRAKKREQQERQWSQSTLRERRHKAEAYNAETANIMGNRRKETKTCRRQSEKLFASLIFQLIEDSNINRRLLSVLC